MINIIVGIKIVTHMKFVTQDITNIEIKEIDCMMINNKIKNEGRGN